MLYWLLFIKRTEKYEKTHFILCCGWLCCSCIIYMFVLYMFNLMFVWLLVCLYDENKHDVGWCLKVLFKSGIDWLNWKWNDCLLTPTPSSKRHKKNVFRPPLKLVLAKWCCYTRCYYCCNSMFLLCFNSVVSNHCICTPFSLFFSVFFLFLLYWPC